MFMKYAAALSMGLVLSTTAVAAPAVRSAQPSNPAASLSVAKSLRSTSPSSKHDNKLAGGDLIVAAVAAAAVVAGIVIVADGGSKSDSN